MKQDLIKGIVQVFPPYRYEDIQIYILELYLAWTEKAAVVMTSIWCKEGLILS